MLAETRNSRFDGFVVTVDEVEEATGLDFFSKLPSDVQKRLESHSDPKAWAWRDSRMGGRYRRSHAPKKLASEGRFGEMHRRKRSFRREPVRSTPEGPARGCAEPEGCASIRVSAPYHFLSAFSASLREINTDGDGRDGARPSQLFNFSTADCATVTRFETHPRSPLMDQ